MSRHYIEMARAGVIYCPHMRDEIPHYTCLNKPTKGMILDFLDEAIEAGVRKRRPFVLAHKTPLRNLMTHMRKKRSY